MNVDGVLAAGTDGLGDTLLFDIGMEGVVHHLAVGVVDGLDESGGVSRGVDEVAFEPVEVFNRQGYAAGRGVFSDRTHAVRSPAQLVGGGAAAAEDAERGVKRSAEEVGAESLAAVKSLLVEIHTHRSDGGIRTDRVVFLVPDRNRGSLESQLIELLTESGALVDIVGEERDLNSVKAGLFQHLEHRVVFFFNASTPQQQVHAKLHRLVSPSYRVSGFFRSRAAFSHPGTA